MASTGFLGIPALLQMEGSYSSVGADEGGPSGLPTSTLGLTCSQSPVGRKGLISDLQ